jgi:hypothetical protein
MLVTTLHAVGAVLDTAGALRPAFQGKIVTVCTCRFDIKKLCIASYNTEDKQKIFCRRTKNLPLIFAMHA